MIPDSEYNITDIPVRKEGIYQKMTSVLWKISDLGTARHRGSWCLSGGARTGNICCPEVFVSAPPETLHRQQSQQITVDEDCRVWSSGCLTVGCQSRGGQIASFSLQSPQGRTWLLATPCGEGFRGCFRIAIGKSAVTDRTYLLFQQGLWRRLGLSVTMLLMISSGRQHSRRERLGIRSTWFPSWFCSLSPDSGSGFSVANGVIITPVDFLYLARLLPGTVQNG